MEAETHNIDAHDKFLDYTSDRMDAPAVQKRFADLKSKVEAAFPASRDPAAVDVLDVGCGIGIQSRLWAKEGYKVTALDYDPGLIGLATERSQAAGLDIDFNCGSAEDIPFEDRRFDVCLAIELLEHVNDWRACLDEFCRVLKPGGFLLLTTSNVICPKQNEYRLPLYSWWPGFIKKYVPELVRTKYPALANHSPCPALHWFSIFQLRRELGNRGMTVKDRVDMIDLAGKPAVVAALVRLARKFDLVRLGFYLFYTGTIVYAYKDPDLA